MCDKDQLTTSQISWIVTPLKRLHEVDIPLVVCARKPDGDTRPLLEYANNCLHYPVW